ncbi:hypothetical protein GCK32_015887, partial [Trichostrongylus colubriformis]
MSKTLLDSAKMVLPISLVERTLMRHEDRGRVVSIILLTSLFSILPV